MSIEIDNAYKHGYTLNGYHIERVLTHRNYRRPKEEERRIELVENKEDKVLAYLIKHLTEYGNTVLGSMKESSVKEYIKKLKKRDINAKYRKVKYPEDSNVWYIVEVKK